MSMDVSAHFSRISAAKRAAHELQELASTCKAGTLREDSNALVAEALELLREIEQTALSRDCNLLPETIGRAALKAEDTLRVLQGRVAKAARESKGNLLSKLTTQITNPHKKIFKEARDGLGQARSAMKREEGLDDDLTSEEEDESTMQQQQQSPSGPEELHLTWDRGVKVSTVALTPGAGGTAASGWLLVALNKKVEIYPGCCSAAKTEVPIADKAQVVTCVVSDPAVGFIWTGCADGSVLLHARSSWGFASLPTSVGLPVRSMAVDYRHYCWVGDDAGIIRVLNLDPNTDRLALRINLAPPQAQALVQLAARQGPMQAAAAAAAAGDKPGSIGKGTPVYAMLGKGGAVFSSGGKFPHSITVYNSQTYQELEVANCESFGATFAFMALPWDDEEEAGNVAQQQQQQPFAGQAGFAGCVGQQQMPGTAVPGIPATGVALGYAAGPLPRATVPASIMAATAAKRRGLLDAAGMHAAPSAAAPLVKEEVGGSWRLLSGHERGQVLLWHFKGLRRSVAAGQRVLQLVCVIGDPRPQYAVRGMAIFHDLSMLVLAHKSGDLTALPMPTPYNEAAQPAHQQSLAPQHAPNFAAVGVALPGPGLGMLGPGTPAYHTWRPRFATIKAHRNGIEATTSLGELLVTASSATVKSWTAERLKLEAQGDGLMFSRQSSTHSSSQTTAAALNAALAADAGSSSGNSRSCLPIGMISTRETRDRAAAAAAALATIESAGYSEEGEQQSGASSGGGVPAGSLPLPPDRADARYGLASSVHATGAVNGGLPAGDTSSSSGSYGSGRNSNAGVNSSGSNAVPMMPGVPGPARLMPASCTAANPMSRESVARRGLAVDHNGTVVVQRPDVRGQHAWGGVAPVGVGEGVPWGTAAAMPPIPPIGGLSAPSGMQLSQQYPPPLPPGVTPLSSPEVMPFSSISTATPGSNGGGLEPTGSVQPESIKLHHVICDSELVLKDVIGSGAEGKVYRGTWTNIDIAAKEYLAVDDLDTSPGEDGQPSEVAMQRARDALRKEVALLTSLNHPNLVRFCGVCLDPPLVVMEFYRHGNVFSMLEKARRQWNNITAKANPSRQATKYMNYFNWDRRLEMLHDVAAGMMYLHKRHYVHGDLRSPNLFVGLDGRVKIGDFGFTKRLSGNKASLQVKRITHPRWVAPELMTRNRLSTASDVYSFAIIMYEMLTWQMPFYDLSKEQVVLRVMGGGRPDMPHEEELPPGTSSSTCLGNYKKLMEECWDQEPDNRPAFDKIAARLKAMIRWRMVIKNSRLQAGSLMAFAAGPRAAREARALAAARAAAATAAAAAAATPRPKVTAALGATAVGAAAGVAAVKGVMQADLAAGADVAAAVVEQRQQAHEEEHDHDPLPVPDHPITAADASDAMLPPLPEGQLLDDATAGVPVLRIMNIAQTSSAAVLEQHLSSHGSAAAIDHDASPFMVNPAGQQQQQLGSGAGRLHSSRAAVVPVPGAAAGGVQYLVVGSDITPGSPHSAYTLSTKASTEVGGMSVDTTGLSTPVHSVPTAPTSGTSTWDIQGQASHRSLQRQLSPASARQDPAAAAAAADVLQTGQPLPPPGYPTLQGCGGVFAPVAVQQVTVASRAAQSAPDGGAVPIEMSGFASAALAAAAAGEPLAAEGSMHIATGKSVKLDPIREASEGTSAISSKDSKGTQRTLAGQKSAAGVASVNLAVAAAAAAEQLPAAGGRASTVMVPVEQQQQQSLLLSEDVKLVPTECSNRIADWLTSQKDVQEAAAGQGRTTAAAAGEVQGEVPGYLGFSPFTGHMQPGLAGESPEPGAAAAAVVDGTVGSANTAAAAAHDPVTDMYGSFAAQQLNLQHGQQQPQQPKQPDVFLAQDSPFFMPGMAPSSSLDVGTIFGGKTPSAATAPTASAAATGAAARAGAVPAYLDADYLDDSCLPLEDDGQGLGAAITVVYHEGLTLAEAANQSNCTMRSSGALSGCTLPSLDGGVASGGSGTAATAAVMRSCGPGARPDSFSADAGPFAAARPDSFTVDAGPFAAMNLGSDLCDSIASGSKAAVGVRVPVSMRDSPFAGAGGFGMTDSIDAPALAAEGGTAAAGTATAPAGSAATTAAAAGYDSFSSPFTAASVGVTGGPGISGIPGGLGPVATQAAMQQSPAASPRQRSPAHPLAAAAAIGDGAGSPSAADPAVGWLANISLAGHAAHGGPNLVQPDYMTGGLTPAAPATTAAGLDGNRAASSTSSRLSASIAPPSSTTAAVPGATSKTNTPPSSSGRNYKGPLDDRCLNKPLGRATDEEDLMEKAQRDLQAWESRASDHSAKQRRTSAASSAGAPAAAAAAAAADTTRASQELTRDQSGQFSSAAADFAGHFGTTRAMGNALSGFQAQHLQQPVGWPPAGMMAPAGQVSAAPMSMASGSYPAYRSGSGFSDMSGADLVHHTQQLQMVAGQPKAGTVVFPHAAPGERVVVVNRPFDPSPHSKGSTDGMCSSPMAMQGGWRNPPGRQNSGPFAATRPGGLSPRSLLALQQSVASSHLSQGMMQGDTNHSGPGFDPGWSHACLGSGEPPALPLQNELYDSATPPQLLQMMQQQQQQQQQRAQQQQQQRQQQPVYSVSPGAQQAQMLLMRQQQAGQQQYGYYQQQQQAGQRRPSGSRY